MKQNLERMKEEYMKVSQVDHMLTDVSRYINSISHRNGIYTTEEYNKVMEHLMNAIFAANEISLDRINKVVAIEEVSG